MLVVTHEHPGDTPFPQVDIPEPLAEAIVVPLQNADLFATMHEVSHTKNRFFAIGHTAVELFVHTALDDEQREAAVVTGLEIFELISSAVRPAYYDTELERAVVTEAAQRLLAGVHAEQAAEWATYAAQRMRKDTPVLNDTVTEIAGRRLGNNDAAITYALAGAGLMRGMQIKVDRKIAS
jgi:hypothetical protein